MATTYDLPKDGLEEEEDDFVDAEEKGFLSNEARKDPPPTSAIPHLSTKFWISAAVNTVATVAIVSRLANPPPHHPTNSPQVFVNKSIFSHPHLRHAQVTFAAFHFLTTFALLFALSRPRIALFEPKRVDIVRILPLALGMIFNVVLPNASLAYSSIQFYQIMRVLVTPCVCVLNLLLLKQGTPWKAAVALVPVCGGVGWMSYHDARNRDKGTTGLGVLFACTGVMATGVYTVWIKKYHAALDCSSMQLLLNQAPVSVGLMLYIIPFSDDVTVSTEVGISTFGLIGLVSSGIGCRDWDLY